MLYANFKVTRPLIPLLDAFVFGLSPLLRSFYVEQIMHKKIIFNIRSISHRVQSLFTIIYYLLMPFQYLKIRVPSPRTTHPASLVEAMSLDSYNLLYGLIFLACTLLTYTLTLLLCLLPPDAKPRLSICLWF